MLPKLEIPNIWIYTHNGQECQILVLGQNGKKYKKNMPTEC